MTIPALLILKHLDDDDKGICKTFFPPMFGEDMNNSSPNKNDNETSMTKDEKLSINKNYQELKKNYNSYKNKSRSEYDFYNLIEKSIL